MRRCRRVVKVIADRSETSHTRSFVKPECSQLDQIWLRTSLTRLHSYSDPRQLGFYALPYASAAIRCEKKYVRLKTSEHHTLQRVLYTYLGFGNKLHTTRKGHRICRQLAQQRFDCLTPLQRRGPGRQRQEVAGAADAVRHKDGHCLLHKAGSLY